MIHDHPAIWSILENDRQSNLIALVSRPAGRLEKFWRSVRDIWNQARVIHATRRELRRMNDHKLKSISVKPDVIEKVVRASVLAHLTVASLDHRDSRPFR